MLRVLCVLLLHGFGFHVSGGGYAVSRACVVQTSYKQVWGEAAALRSLDHEETAAGVAGGV